MEGVPQPQELGRKRSPWLFTTYPSPGMILQVFSCWKRGIGGVRFPCSNDAKDKPLITMRRPISGPLVLRSFRSFFLTVAFRVICCFVTYIVTLFYLGVILVLYPDDTLHETNISHLGKRKIIFKHALSGGYVSSLEGVYYQGMHGHSFSLANLEKLTVRTSLEVWKISFSFSKEGICLLSGSVRVW